jgi:hypothetical protein
VRFAIKDYPAALDEISQTLAFARIESEIYPEALYLSAQCYEALATTNAFATRLVQLTLPGTNRTVAVTANVSATQGLTANSNYVSVAKSIYQEIVTRYPNSPAAQKSQPKLPPPAATATNQTSSSATK